MKTFLRKLKLSFLAMLCGWIACNIAWWVGFMLEVEFHELNFQAVAMKAFFIGVATGFVIFVAWLAIFLPVDLIISDDSKLRKPWAASICGFIAGSCVIVASLIWSVWRGDPTNDFVGNFPWKALPYLLSPGITGMVAAFVRSRSSQPLLTKP